MSPPELDRKAEYKGRGSMRASGTPVFDRAHPAQLPAGVLLTLLTGVAFGWFCDHISRCGGPNEFPHPCIRATAIKQLHQQLCVCTDSAEERAELEHSNPQLLESIVLSQCCTLMCRTDPPHGCLPETFSKELDETFRELFHIYLSLDLSGNPSIRSLCIRCLTVRC